MPRANFPVLLDCWVSRATFVYFQRPECVSTQSRPCAMCQRDSCFDLHSANGHLNRLPLKTPLDLSTRHFDAMISSDVWSATRVSCVWVGLSICWLSVYWRVSFFVCSAVPVCNHHKTHNIHWLATLFVIDQVMHQTVVCGKHRVNPIEDAAWWITDNDHQVDRRLLML